MAKKKAEKAGEISKKISEPATKEDVYKKTADNHKQAAFHHIEAAKHHEEAVKYYEAGKYEKAAHSSFLAYGHHTIAGGFISDDAKYHAHLLKQTNYQ